MSTADSDAAANAQAERHLAVATSLLDEVHQAVVRFQPGDSADRAGSIHQSITLALSELERAASLGLDVSDEVSRAHYNRGLLLFEVAKSYPLGRERTKAFGLAIEAFQRGLAVGGPSGLKYYNIGVAYANLGRTQEAVENLQLAEQWGDEKVSLDASKMIAKLKANPPRSGRGCYIATACYGGYDHPSVLVLRRYRDERLLTSAFGRYLVKLYYAASPALARRLGSVPWLARAVRRCFLDPIVRRLT